MTCSQSNNMVLKGDTLLRIRFCTSDREFETPKTLDHHIIQLLFFLDLSKAFDRVWRNKLIIKLFNTFGIRDRALSWIFDFLKDREIRVRFRDSLSKTFRLSQGVPQGSVLSLLLFPYILRALRKSSLEGVRWGFSLMISSSGTLTLTSSI
ncbi:reverse transcriptase domain-containing protein [Trichonephila clavipes]|nr:reverse transcriptase domain-containing protein [Trichonephila clavipes]